MLTAGSPWGARRVGHEVLDDVVRRFMLTLWNVYGFFVTYANADGFDPDSSAAIARRAAPHRSLDPLPPPRDHPRRP